MEFRILALIFLFHCLCITANESDVSNEIVDPLCDGNISENCIQGNLTQEDWMDQKEVKAPCITANGSDISGTIMDPMCDRNISEEYHNGNLTEEDWMDEMALNGSFRKPHNLQKRGLIQLTKAIRCVTGRSSLRYLGYGCHCGPGGKGGPIDATDWCCHAHDCCYKESKRHRCKPKIGSYKWSCSNRTFHCPAQSSWCKSFVCNCDREFSRCISRARFNSILILYPNGRCRKPPQPCR
ncbi:phospholipase A2 [Xenopus laevis]|uniref:Phospholipase A2 n=2 Tax=Xenopus laevis TaxID=8355 RepID=A0A1L8EXP1_XENLA|nr:phospholipase A2 [Xenopus laevis]OCT64049.1 hypothetical protein XELAEV_18045151mg [Xenopus laevis]